jgi:PqqD family protein of HPr-rel-A system
MFLRLTDRMNKNLKSDGWSTKIAREEAVIYAMAWVDTHYLKPLTLALYQTCCGHPGYTSDELASTLATHLGVPDSPQLHELTEITLNRLRKIGLLEFA